MAEPEMEIQVKTGPSKMGYFAALIGLAPILFVCGVAFTAGAHYFNWLVA